MAGMVLSATTAAQNHASFDTDSDPVGVDNRCSECIFHKVTDFIGELAYCNRITKGFVVLVPPNPLVILLQYTSSPMISVTLWDMHPKYLLSTPTGAESVSNDA